LILILECYDILASLVQNDMMLVASYKLFNLAIKPSRSKVKAKWLNRQKFSMQPVDKYLWRLSGEALALCYRAAEGYEASLTKYSSLVLSGEPVADLNYGIIDACPNSEDTLQEYISLARARKLPMLILFSPEVASRLKPVAQKLGLQFVEHFPWMTYRPINPFLQGTSYQIVRVEHLADQQEANSVIASAFSAPVESVNRAFGPTLLDAPGFNLFVAKKNGKVVSTVQTTRAGSNVGIWAMATDPNLQHKGAGKALLNYVIAYHHQRGAELFFLGATPAGKQLYQKVGFKTIYSAEVWVC
jgi:ribosomal protein S18 acetylase RimI-like enzyme